MRCAIVLTCAALAGCATGALSTSFREREQPAMSHVLEDLASAPAREEQPAVVAVTQDGAIVAWDLTAGRMLFRVDAAPTATPMLAGQYVVDTEARGVVVRRLSDGETAFVIDDTTLRLVGADGEGDALVASFAHGEGESPLGLVVGAAGGALRWQQELPLPVAVPALAGSVVVVPWAHQRVSFLDFADGTERARLRLEDAVVGHAVRRGAQVLLGQHELFPIDAQLTERARRGTAFLRPQGRPLPGQPPFLPDGYEGASAPDNARSRVRLAWGLSDGAEGLALSDGLLYFVFYRLVFALEAGADEVRWVRTLGTDVVGAAAGEGGIVVATDDGNLRLLDARDGSERWTAAVGARLRAADIRVAGFRPDVPAAEGEREPLRDQLERAAALEDARLDGGRALAIRYLARSTEEAVTARLIGLCAPRAVMGPARREACEALAARENGAQYVREALRGRASFLENTPAPPVGALARAAANMHLRNTVPFLLRHLDDPATPNDELPGLLDGLRRLGDARAAPAIEAFLRLYHADVTDGQEADAIRAAAAALLALAPDRFGAVQELASDEAAPQLARDALAGALTERTAAQATAAQASAPAEPPPTARPAPPPADDRPERITDAIRREVLRPIEARLLRCLTPAGADPLPSARVSLFVDEEGRPQTISVTPAALQECVEPLIRTRTFPRTRRGREALVHVIRR